MKMRQLKPDGSRINRVYRGPTYKVREGHARRIVQSQPCDPPSRSVRTVVPLAIGIAERYKMKVLLQEGGKAFAMCSTHHMFLDSSTCRYRDLWGNRVAGISYCILPVLVS